MSEKVLGISTFDYTNRCKGNEWLVSLSGGKAL